MALATDNSEAFRTATAYEASKETRLVKPEDADRTRAQGRAGFYNALMGRYGLPGSVATQMDARVADTAAGDSYDLSEMNVTEVLALAQRLTGGGTSSLGLFGGGNTTGDPTLDLIVEYEARIETLTQEGADPKAIDGAREVLRQARLLQAEQALFRSLDAARDDREDGRGGVGYGGFLNAGIGVPATDALGPFSAPADLLSIPPSAITLLMTSG